MRKGFNIAALAGAVAMAVSTSSAFANGHPQFGQWSDTGGTISGHCQAGWSCTTVADGTGFIQFMAKNDTSGETYIGTIVSDPNNTADRSFSDESYVRMEICNGTCATPVDNGGIAAQQNIFERSTDGTVFDSDVLIQTGTNFGSATTPYIQITQTLEDQNGAGTATVRGDDFASNFYYSAYDTSATPDGVRDGFQMEIDQIAGLQSATDATGTANDVQSFTYREAAGVAQTGAGSLTVPGQNAVSYASGDDIKAVWLGQEVDIGATGSLGGSFSYLSFENKDAAAGATGIATDFDLTSSAGPTGATWDATSPFNLSFGAGTSSAPTLNDPSGGL